MAPVVIVTGGNRGIGAATVRLAVSAGYAVCLSYRSHAEEANDWSQSSRHKAAGCSR